MSYCRGNGDAGIDSTQRSRSCVIRGSRDGIRLLWTAEPSMEPSTIQTSNAGTNLPFNANHNVTRSCTQRFSTINCRSLAHQITGIHAIGMMVCIPAWQVLHSPSGGSTYIIPESFPPTIAYTLIVTLRNRGNSASSGQMHGTAASFSGESCIQYSFSPCNALRLTAFLELTVAEIGSFLKIRHQSLMLIEWAQPAHFQMSLVGMTCTVNHPSGFFWHTKLHHYNCCNNGGKCSCTLMCWISRNLETYIESPKRLHMTQCLQITRT